MPDPCRDYRRHRATAESGHTWSVDSGARNRLYYGDCYDVLRQHVAPESIDLVYLDPPFNSNRDYNVLFKEQTGAPAEAQVKAFTDTWKWSPDL